MRVNQEGEGQGDLMRGLSDPDYDLENTDVVAKDTYCHHII